MIWCATDAYAPGSRRVWVGASVHGWVVWLAMAAGALIEQRVWVHGWVGDLAQH